MALVKEWREQGNVLFKNRSWIPIFFLLFSGIYLVYKPGPWIEQLGLNNWILICFAVSMIGQIIRAITVGFADARTSGRNTSAGQVAESVNTTGIYSTVRHPLYLGNYFMWLGVMMFPANLEFVIMATLAYWLYYEKIMYAEEAFLTDKFGKGYTDWAAKTPAFIPKVSQWKTPKNGFLLKVVIRQEYLGFCAVFFLLSILSVVFTSMQQGQFFANDFTKVFFGVGLVVFVLVRLISKCTKALIPHFGA